MDRPRDPATVQEQHRTASPFLHRGELREQRRRERIPRLPPEIDQPYGRHRGSDARRELETLEARPALHPRRRASVHRDRTFQRSALGSHRTGVVARIRLLLERGVVLLVDDDEPELAHGREDGGTSPDDDARLAARNPLALVAPLGITERRVQDGDAVAEACCKPTDGLRRERDLGDEHDCAEPASECGGTGLEVDLRLAASRRAVQENVISAAGERCRDLFDRRALGRGELFGLGLSRERIAGRRRPSLASPGSSVRCDERQRPRRSGAVVLRNPQRELDERRSEPGRRRVLRRRSPHRPAPRPPRRRRHRAPAVHRARSRRPLPVPPRPRPRT